MPGRKKADRLWIVRLVCQAAFTAYVLYVAVVHALGIPRTASLHALCPFGAVESLWSLAAGGAYLPKIHQSSVVLSVGLLASAVVAGGAFCGWVCPLGSLGDALSWLRKKLHIRELTLPARLDALLRWARYLVLAGIMAATISTSRLWFEDYDPYHTLFSLGWLFDVDLAAGWPGYLVTLVMLAGSLLIPRFWCRYLCPLGGLLSLVQRVAPVKVRRNNAACIDCKRCDKACPLNLHVSMARAVTHDCSMCLRCVSACPAKGALETALPGYEDKTAEEVRA